MSLRRQLAQLLVLRASGYALDQQRRYPRWELSNDELQRGLAEGVGGVILLGGSAADLALRCRQLQDKLDAKNKEVINLMEALKTAEHNESATAGKGEGKGRTPRIDGKCFPPVLHRVWADGTAWALLGGVGEDGEAGWYCESRS